MQLLQAWRRRLVTGTLIETLDGTPFFDPNTGPAGVSRRSAAGLSSPVAVLNRLGNILLQSQIQSSFNDLKPTHASSIASWADNNP
jgi:hypothetical protein